MVIKTAGASPCKGVAPHCISSHCTQHLTLPFRKRPYKMGFIYECSWSSRIHSVWWNEKYIKSISAAHGCIMAVLRKSTYATSCIFKNIKPFLLKRLNDTLIIQTWMYDIYFIKNEASACHCEKKQYLLPVINFELSRKISNFRNLRQPPGVNT